MCIRDSGLNIKPITVVDEALEIALVNPLIPIKEDPKDNQKTSDDNINIQSSVSKNEITAH